VFGNSIGHLIGFLFTPFIARIYLPEAYGAFAIFNSLVINLALFSTLNYSNAIILPKSENKLIKLLQLIFVLLLINLVANYLLVFLGGEILMNFLGSDQIGPWIYFIPIIVFFTGVNQSLISLANRLADFRNFSKAKILSITFSKSFTLGYGYFASGNLVGLIIGELLIRPINTILIVSNKAKEIITSCGQFNLQEIIKVAKVYNNYPSYYLPASWFLILITQIPLYFIAKYYGVSNTGYFALATSLLNIPIIFFSNSASAVFIQKASIYYPNKIEKLKSITLELIYFLIFFSSLAFGLIFGFGDLIFWGLLGKNWKVAGDFASILSIGSAFYFVALPISTLFRILKKEKQFLFLNMLFVVLIISTFIISLKSSIETIILLYSIEFGIYSIFTLIYIITALSIKRPVVHILKLLSIVLIAFSLSYLIRLGIDLV
jgi:O-antigen/teichoic acid export membrane protein